MNVWKRCLLFALLLTALPAFAGQQAKTVTMAVFWFAGSLDPAKDWNSWMLSRCGIGENLVQIDENMNLKPVIAESWKQKDATTWLFTIREGVTFHNGRTVDAAAVKASLERALAVTNRTDARLPVKEMAAEGNQLTMTLTEPSPTLLNNLADPVFTIIDAQSAKENPEKFKNTPVATGPFKVVRFSPEKGLELERCADYWNGATNVEKLNVKYVPGDTARLMALQAGELDVTGRLTPEGVAIIKKDDRFTVLDGPNLRVLLLRTNFKNPLLQKRRFRHAIDYAIQKDLYATKLEKGIPARGPFNALFPFHHEGNEPHSYDMAKAKQLLDSLNLRDSNGDGIREYKGKNIELQFACPSDRGVRGQSIGLAMQEDLKKVGLGMKVVQMEHPQDLFAAGKADFLLTSWISAPAGDPEYFLHVSYESGASSNSGDYSNAEFDAVMKKLHTEMNQQKRYALAQQAVNILLEDSASIFLAYESGNMVYNKRLEGVYRFPSDIYYIDNRLHIK